MIYSASVVFVAVVAVIENKTEKKNTNGHMCTTGICLVCNDSTYKCEGFM